MASVKLAQLVIRTLAKPISTKLKQQAKSHPTFRDATINFAQWLHQAEINARVGLLREAQPKVRMLNDETAIEKGANFLSEAFLFAVAAALIVGETMRSSRKESKRRDRVDDELTALREEVTRMTADLRKRSDEDHRQLLDVSDSDRHVALVVDQLVDVLRRGQWLERTLDQDEQWQARTRALHQRVSQESVHSDAEPS